MAYDHNGCLLKIEVISEQRPGLMGHQKTTERVRITGIAQDTNGTRDELKKALLKYFKKTKMYKAVYEMSTLHNIVNQAITLYGFTR